MMRLTSNFFEKDVLYIAPLLIGSFLVRKFPCGTIQKYMITETEAYRGEEDLACHASKGRTKRTEIMYGKGGFVYVYLVYGMYWMLNLVTGKADEPQAVLIRSVHKINGPGRVSKKLEINRTFYGENLTLSERIWLEENGEKPRFESTPRIGIDYAGDWKNKPWRYVATDYKSGFL